MNPSNPQQQTYHQYFEEESLNLKKYFFMMLYNWYWFVLFAFLGFVGAFLVNRYTEPVYEVSNTIIIGDEPTTSEQMFSDIRFFRLKRLRENVQNEIIKLKSYELNLRTIRELDFDITYAGVGRSGIKEVKLYNSSPFIVQYDTTQVNVTGHRVFVELTSKNAYRLEINDQNEIDTILNYGEKFNYPGYHFKIFPRNQQSGIDPKSGYNKYYFVLNSEENLAEKYRNSITAEPVSEEVSIIQLTCKGHNPNQQAFYLNKLSEVFILTGLEEKNRQAENALSFIDGLVKELTDSLQSSGKEIQDFRVSQDVINIDKEGEALFTRIQELQREKASLNINLKFFNYLFEYIHANRAFNNVMLPSVIGIQDAILNNIVDKLNELYANRSMLQYTNKETSPNIEMINSEIQTTEKVLVEHLGNQKKTTQIRLKEINERLSRAEKEIRKLPAKEQQLLNMERKYNVSNQFYTYLLEKRAEAGINRASNVPDNKILDAARPKTARQNKPKSSVNYFAGVVIGLLIPFIYLLLKEYINNKIEDRNYIEKNTRVPIIGSIGHNKTTSELPVVENPKSALAESFRVLRTNLNYMIPDEKEKIISITSTVIAEGKTFIAMNMASIIALSNRRTLLVGLDMRKPQIHKIFNVDNEKGISTYLIGEHEIDEIILSSNIENLYITPSGPIPPNPAELIDSERMNSFFEKSKEKFEYIILDTPPVAMVTDALLLAKFSRLNIFIVRQNFSNKNVLDLINDLHQNKRVANPSLLINDVQAKRYYGYNYKDYYGYGYYAYG